MYYLAIDPGRDKCGLALFQGKSKENLIFRKIIPTIEMEEYFKKLFTEYEIPVLILGDRTNHSNIQKSAKIHHPQLEIVMVDEHLSSQEGRVLYFQLNPPKGLKRLIPRGLLFPPEPYDDCVALILFQRYLDKEKQI